MDNIAIENAAVLAAGDGLWHDLPMPANTSGKARYRKLANQNMLEVYINGTTNKSISAGSITFGPLPVDYRPTNQDSIMGMIMTDDGTNKKVSFQFLTVETKGDVFLPAPNANYKIKTFAFYGVIDL